MTKFYCGYCTKWKNIDGNKGQCKAINFIDHDQSVKKGEMAIEENCYLNHDDYVILVTHKEFCCQMWDGTKDSTTMDYDEFQRIKAHIKEHS